MKSVGSSPVKRWALGLALAALLGAPTARAQVAAGGAPKVTVPSPSEASTKLSYRLAHGQTGIYRLSYTGNVELDTGVLAGSVAQAPGSSHTPTASRRERIKVDQKATLHWRVIAEDTAGWTLSARLQEVDFRQEGASDGRRELLELPFTMRLDRNGTMREFTFRKGYPATLGNSIRSMVTPLQVVVADPGSGTWAAREATDELFLETRYQRTAVDSRAGIAKVIRTIASASPSATQTSTLAANGEIAVRVGNAEARIDLALSGRGVQRLESRQLVTMGSKRGFVSSHEDTYVAERVDGSLATLPETAAAAAADLADPAFALARTYDVDPAMRPSIEGREVPAVMADYVDQAKKLGGGHDLLMNYVRRYPARTEAVARALDGLAVDDEKSNTVVGFGFAALATAGHREAQQVLVRVASEPGWKSLSSIKALIAMLDLDLPQPSTVAAVWRLRSAPGKGEEADVVHSVATNVYGALGNTEMGNKAITDEVLRTLGRHLQGTTSQYEQMLALDALSNVGDSPVVMSLAAPYFASSNEELRMRAFSTFRLMKSDAAFERFASRYAAEKSTKVRHEAVRTVEQMAPSAVRNAWCTREVALTTDADAATVLVQILGRNLGNHPDNAAVLRTVLATQTDRQVRRAVYAYLAPASEGGK